ncbi:ABC transporter permease [Johnsonella ignava]|uniref:ABC transporter permease n=1 Tax=Johnsonella ignava TaxID=43995 RepID=UPI0023F381A8|nr:ABC transporter permease [Johnsonella ignava]
MVVENLKMAIAALVANKMRSFLTMLGIIIGIGSVIAIVAIGDTVRRIVSSIYENFGATQSIIYPNFQDDSGYRLSDDFTKDDIETLKKVFGNQLAYIDTNGSASGDVKTRMGINKVTLTGADYNFIDFQSFKITSGRFFSQSDIKQQRYVAVIEDTAALKMFGTENATGRTFRQKLNGALREFLVIGIYHLDISPVQKLFMGNNQSVSAYIPSSFFYGNDESTAFSLRIFADKSFKGEKLARFNNDFIEYLAKMKNRKKEDYYIVDVGAQMSQVDQFLGGVSVAMGGIAAISLLVGGIGIMNIMLVSVTERTREIGTRKALGATTGDILTQFLIESAVISAIGGTIGIIIASAGMSIVGVLLKQSVVIKPVAVLLAVGFSAVVGIFFGIYPAQKAAKRDPIECLRYE